MVEFNDVFRKQYTPLTDEQKARVLAVKEKAEALLKEFGNSGDLLCLVHAKERLEEAVMWAVKGITTK